ncbi:MAG: signal peptide peptidase SppA [Kordiimonas sp.]|nr:signal peptide peptidase SppA [Kordiimonas sp.]
MALDLDSLIDRRRLKRKLTFWRLGAIIAVVILLILLLSQQGTAVGGPYLARVTIDGVIMEDQKRIDMLHDVAHDKNAKALLVHVNSPGGGSTASEELYHALRRVAAQKPVVITMGTLAASGGYITALAGDHIFARDTTITGSIGVIMQYTEFGDLLDKIGVSMDQVKSGAIKGEPSGYKPLSDEARTIFQTMIDDSYNWFVELVADRRAIAPDRARELADGRVYTGRQALSAGLIDSLGGQHDARLWLQENKGISPDLPLLDVDKTAQERLMEGFFASIGGKMPFSKPLSLDGLVSLWQPNQ